MIQSAQPNSEHYYTQMWP